MVKSVQKDIASPSAKKNKVEKPLGPKLVGEYPSVGHNKGEVIPALVELMEEDLALDEKKKSIAQAQRDIRNRAKTEFGVMAAVWAYEKRMRKMDKDVRIQLESGVHDLKEMLGYQIELDLKPDTVARTEDELADPSAPRNDIINRL